MRLKGYLSYEETVTACFQLEDSIGLEVNRHIIYANLRYSENVADRLSAIPKLSAQL